MPTRVAVDAMGGDKAPSVVVKGAVRAVKRDDCDVHVLLVGPEETLREAVAQEGDLDRLPLRVVDAPEVIGMSESPAAAVKSKKRSSIHVGLTAHKEGKADAFASAGNTGAVMAAALFILGRLPNIARPSIVGFCPTMEGHCIFLDVGSSVDCKPEHLDQFALMGSIYAKRILKRENPVVGLLNIGEEPGKGNELVKEAYELLDDNDRINFRGNVEGRDLMQHAADVVVCDGFVGNVVLKFGESLATTLTDMVKREMEEQELSAAEQKLVLSVLRNVQRPFDYQEHGGAPLLGVSGNVIIGHGSSSARAVERMILKAGEVAEKDMAGSIEAAFQGKDVPLER